MGDNVGGKSDDITLKEIILIIIDWSRYLFSKWIIILAVSLVGSAIGFFMAYNSKPVYTAQLTLALDDKGAGGSAYSGLASQLGLDLGGGGGSVFSGENNIELLKSRFIIETTLLTPVNINGQTDLLINRYIDYNEIRKGWENNPELKNITFKAGESRDEFGIKKDSVLKGIFLAIKKGGLKIDRLDKKMSIIEVTMMSPDELFAKLFVEAIVVTSSKFYIETKTKKSKANLDILSMRLDSVKKVLDDEIYGAALDKDKNLNVVRAQGGVRSAKKQLNIQILTTMYSELVKNTEIAKFTVMKDEPMIQIIDRPILPLDKKKKSKLFGLIGGGVAGVVVSILGLWGWRMKTIIMED